MKQIKLAEACLKCDDIPFKRYPEIIAWVIKHEIPSHVIFRGEEMEVIKDCLSADYEYEIANYPRQGLIRKELKSGDVVEFHDFFQNFFGIYCIVWRNGTLYHVPVLNLKIVRPYTQETLNAKIQELKLAGAYNLPRNELLNIKTFNSY